MNNLPARNSALYREECIDLADDKFSEVGINISEKATVIWNVADVLRGPFKPHEYGLVILPMTVVKRFHDCLLPTYDKVQETYEKVKNMAVNAGFLTRASGYQFYNTSKFTFEKLLADADNIEDNFKDYLNGFSENVQDVLSKFDFETIIRRMVESNTLYLVIKEFASDKGYLGPDRISAVDCGYIFEDLVRRFSESFGEEAGAHFTSRDVIYLMTDILLSDADLSKGGNITVYDMAMGTSQMLGCMEERIHQLNNKMNVSVFGQEFNPSTYAIAKADMMIRGGNPNDMRFGDTLSEDQFKDYTFQYIISNPPFGIDWKREKKEVEKEHKKGVIGRFAPGLPKISDGQQLFVLNGLKKLAADGKMAIIQNGSPLFSGDAESGPSEIRRYIIENDYLDAIIQLSTDMFMNTGISTYIWVLNKNKPAHRQGKVQLIDASSCAEPRRKSIGTKRNDITDLCRELIVRAYGECRDGVVYGDSDGVRCESKVFDNIECGYHKITVERPLRLAVKVNDETLAEVKSYLEKSGFFKEDDFVEMTMKEIMTMPIEKLPRKVKLENLAAEMAKFYLTHALEILEAMKRDEPYLNYGEFEQVFENHPKNTAGIDLFTLYISKKISKPLFEANPEAEIVYDGRHNPVPDVDLRDTENVPLQEDIEEYFEREVLPYASDAWIDKKKTKVGYEIPMTRYFYKYESPESVEEISARIHELELDIQDSLDKLFADEV